MDGTLSLEDALRERLRIIDCKPEDLMRFLDAYPPARRFTEVRALLAMPRPHFGLSLYCLCIIWDRHQCPGHVQGIQELVAALQARGIAVYLISGGFR